MANIGREKSHLVVNMLTKTNYIMYINLMKIFYNRRHRHLHLSIIFLMGKV